MDKVFDIFMALIGQTPWFILGYIVHKIYFNKPKHTSKSISDKLTIVSER